MSQEQVDVVARAFAAFEAGGADALGPFVTEDLVVYPFPEWMEQSEYHGFEGFRELIAGWTDGFDDFIPRADEFRDAGDDTVVFLGWNTGRLRGTNNPIKQPVSGVFRFAEDNRIREIRYFMTWHEGLEAAGVAE